MFRYDKQWQIFIKVYQTDLVPPFSKGFWLHLSQRGFGSTFLKGGNSIIIIIFLL